MLWQRQRHTAKTRLEILGGLALVLAESFLLGAHCHIDLMPKRIVEDIEVWRARREIICLDLELTLSLNAATRLVPRRVIIFDDGERPLVRRESFRQS